MFGKEVAMEKHIPWQPMAAIQWVNCGHTISQPLAFHAASPAMHPTPSETMFFFPFGTNLLSRIEPGPWFIEEKVNDFL